MFMQQYRAAWRKNCTMCENYVKHKVVPTHEQHKLRY